MRAGLWLNFLLFCLSVNYFNLNHAFSFKMTNLVCESFNKSWVAYTECRLRAISRNKTTLTVFVMVSEPANNIFLNIKILKKANGYKPWIMDYLVDGCKFMRQMTHPVARIGLKLIKHVSTINHTCPYYGRHGVKDFHDITGFPLLFPSGDYLLNLTWIFNRKPQFVTFVYFTFWDE